MDLITIFVLITLLLVIASIVIMYRRIYIIKDGKTTKRDLVIQIGFLVCLSFMFVILPIDIDITDINKNSTVITTQKTITEYFVVDGTDTLLVSKNIETDILSTGILPDSLNLKSETKYTIFGEVTSKKILE